MRERLAEILAALTAIIVVALAATFSLVQNVPQEASMRAEQAVPPGSGAGRAVYERLGCAGCHAIGGEGNPRHRLDGVGARHSRAELRDWIVASERVQSEIPASVARLKQTYEDLPAHELGALVDYLVTLQSPPPRER